MLYAFHTGSCLPSAIHASFSCQHPCHGPRSQSRARAACCTICDAPGRAGLELTLPSVRIKTCASLDIFVVALVSIRQVTSRQRVVVVESHAILSQTWHQLLLDRSMQCIVDALIYLRRDPTVGTAELLNLSHLP